MHKSHRVVIFIRTSATRAALNRLTTVQQAIIQAPAAVVPPFPTGYQPERTPRRQLPSRRPRFWPGSARHELVSIDPELGFVVREISADAFAHPWHQHPELEITLIQEGEGLRYVGDSVQEFGAGDLCLIGADTPHAWVSAPADGSSVRCIQVQFVPGALGRGFFDVPAARPISDLCERARLGLVVGGETHARVAREVAELVSPGIRPVERLARLLSVLAVLSASSDLTELALSTPERPSYPPRDETATRVLSFIHEHAKERLSQEQVARAAGLSRASLGRFFPRYLGKTFVRYVSEVRVGLACRCLLESSRSVREIAFDVGYGNLANFNRRFRELKGMTPTEYRRRARSLD
jgi:AraC-like DNA-binding protein